MIFLERACGRFSLKNFHSDIWIFVLTGDDFRVTLVRNLSVSEMKL